MKASIRGHAQSVLSIDAKGITIWLPWAVFGKVWQDVATYLREAIEKREFIVFTQRAMTERGKGKDAPRWKRTPVDVLSWFLFLLKVPVAHELVQLWQTIDWRAINRIAGAAYKNAHGGRLAWAPAQLMAILILMFLYGVPHETTILARLSENIVWCWFCGFSLFEPFPKHDALYELRKRLGIVRFERILTMVVKACLDAGLIKNELVNFDPTPVTASAHRWSPYERAVILTRAFIRYLENVWAGQTDPDEHPQPCFPEAIKALAAKVALEILPHKGLQEVKPERVVESVEQWEKKAQKSDPIWKETSEVIAEELSSATLDVEDAGPLESLAQWAEKDKDDLDCEQSNGLCKWLVEMGKKVLKRLPHARGDQGARVGRTTNYTWFCGYLLAFMVDSFRQIITAVAWRSGNARQAKMFIPAMEAHIERVGKPKETATDSAFDDPEVHTYLDREAIVGHITSRDHAKPRDGGLGTDQVTWLEDDNGRAVETPLCPNQIPLTPKGKPQDGRQLYEGTACTECAMYERCYPSGKGKPKRFSLDPEEHRRWQQNREHCLTEAYKAAQRQRFVSEGRFGLAKMNHNGARAPYRSDEMNHIAGLMIAIVMDYRILARHQQSIEKAA
jgi:transposase